LSRCPPIIGRSPNIPTPMRQGHLPQKTSPLRPGPPWGSRHSPTVESSGGAVSYDRGTTVRFLANSEHIRQSRPVSGLGLSHFSGESLYTLVRCCLLGWRRCLFRGGLVFEAHRLLYHSTLGLRVIKKKKTVWKHGLSTEQFPVSAYVGSSKNLKDLKSLYTRVRCCLLGWQRRLFGRARLAQDREHCLAGCHLQRRPSVLRVCECVSV